jgi:hypothetical protein
MPQNQDAWLDSWEQALHPPNAELVAVHWLRSLDLGTQVATTLPSRENQSFREDGFVQVPVAPGGAPDPETTRRSSMVQVDSYAFTQGSRSVPWGKAATILQRVVEAAVVGRNLGRVVTPSAFLDARLMGVEVNSDPTRVPDEGGMAHYSSLLQFWWVPITEEVAP